MARTKADLTFFVLVSDYDPAHYNWTKKELAALGDCKAIAEVIKNRLEDNGKKVKEMYVIAHRGEKKADSKSKELHGNADEAKTHYHLLARFEPSHGATLEEIAKYIGVPMQAIVKPKQGRDVYNNNLAYLIHIKDEDKIPYAPEHVVTLAGTDYMDYYNENKERWIKARAIKAKKKSEKPLDRLFREAVSKMESGELLYSELAGTEYRRLLFEPKYMKILKRKDECVREVAEQDNRKLRIKIENGEITTLDEITANKDWKLAYMYHQKGIKSDLQKQKEGTLKQENEFYRKLL